MKPTILPKTTLGKLSLILILSFIISLTIFFTLIQLGERGGDTFFSNLKLTIPFLIAVFSAILSFITGITDLIKSKQKSILVLISTIIGFLVFLFISAEIMFPH